MLMCLIYVGGISPRLEGEEMKVSQQGFSGGDRTYDCLTYCTNKFFKSIKSNRQAGRICNDDRKRQLLFPWEAENIPAIINAWYGGQAGGIAVADVLFGDYNPSGRLPVTFYKSDNDLPPFEDYSMANRTYRYFKGEALYPFGFGLSYTTFRYADLHLSKNTINKDESVQAEVTVTNTGKYKGDEVVQLYITHEGISYAPLQALKGFKRITLSPGQSQKVSFMITPEQLKLVDDSGNSTFIPGKVKLIIAGSSPSKRNEESGAAKASEVVLTLK